MSKISYPQVVKDVANAVRTGTDTTDLIPVGELADTILGLLTRMPAVGGLTVNYKSITYNDDNTITLIDTDDVEHTMECIYTDGKLTYITFDGQKIKLDFDGDKLIGIDNKEINLESAPSFNTGSGESGGKDYFLSPWESPRR
jgi:hypothetical protein